MNGQFCGLITQLFSKKLWLYTRTRVTVMNPDNSPDNRKFSDFKPQQKNQNGCPV